MKEDQNNNETVDLSDAFKDSGAGAKLQDGQQRSSQTFYSGTPRTVRWVIKYSGGFIKDEKQASYVLIGFVILATIVSLILLFGEGRKREIFTPGAETPAEQVITPTEF